MNMMEEWKQREIKKMREQFKNYTEFKYFDLLLKQIEKEG